MISKREYIEKLSIRVVKKELSYDDLVSFTKIEKLNSVANEMRDIHVKSIISFSERVNFLNKIFEKILSNGYERIYFLDSLSRKYGAILLENLMEFNLGFEFKCDNAGVFSLLSIDGEGEIVLDFYEDDSVLLLEVEIYGKWAKFMSDSYTDNTNSQE